MLGDRDEKRAKGTDVARYLPADSRRRWDPWYWGRVGPLLQERGHKAIPVRLPAASDTAGLPEYVETAVDAAAATPNWSSSPNHWAASPRRWPASDLPVNLLVFLNAMIPNPGELPAPGGTTPGQAAAMRAMNLQEGREADAPFDPFVFFLHDLPPEVLEEAADHNEPESAAVFGSACTMTSWPDIPIRAMSGQDDRFFPTDFQRRVAQERLGITPDVVPGGHLAALAQTGAVADRG